MKDSVRVAVISCWNYRDTWNPFFHLFRKFWPDCPHETWLVTDSSGPEPQVDVATYIAGQGQNWCQVLSCFASISDKPILLFLDDFFLNAPVNPELIERGLEQYETHNAGCVRLYSCPGPDEDYGDPHFGKVARNADYRISTMPAIWRPSFLKQIAERYTNPWDFETQGTAFSRTLADEVFAFKRELNPWPVSIMATGITRGKWNRSARELFTEHNIEADYSLRECWA